MTLKLSILASAIALPASQAATINISSLDQLGPASETITSTGSLPTYDLRTVDGVTNVDTKDATFAALVDFNSGASTSNHILWETGGATIGASIAYQPSTGTITVSHSSNGGSGLDQLTHTLTGAQVAAGELEVVWAYNSTDIEFELFIDGISAGVTTEQTGTVSQNDWSGGNAAGFGVFGGGFAAGNGSNGNLPNLVNFGSAGTINTTTGLRFWADVDAQIPEPSGLSLLGFASLLILRRRAR